MFANFRCNMKTTYNEYTCNLAEMFIYMQYIHKNGFKQECFENKEIFEILWIVNLIL